MNTEMRTAIATLVTAGVVALLGATGTATSVEAGEGDWPVAPHATQQVAAL